jgi:hypothetical protein
VRKNGGREESFRREIADFYNLIKCKYNGCEAEHKIKRLGPMKAVVGWGRVWKKNRKPIKTVKIFTIFSHPAS